MTTNSPAVDALLLDAQPDFQALGLNKRHIPEVIALATDKERLLGDGLAGAINAWHALAYLGGEKSINALINLFPLVGEGVPIIVNQMPLIFTQLGTPALPALADVLANDSIHEAKIVAVNCLIAIADADPAQHPTITTALSTHLSQHETNNRELNGYLVMGLCKCQAQDAAELIEAAFEAGHVDPFIIGDWDKVQIELGLATYEEIRNKERKAGGRPPSLREVLGEGMVEMGLTSKRGRKAKKSKKSKKKK